MNKSKCYDDIINLPHHVSVTHPRMSQHDRAAQFAPFAALTGYDDEITEMGRITDNRPELDDTTKARLDCRLQILVDNAEERPSVSITFFKADERKNGGAYINIHGNFRDLPQFCVNENKKLPIRSDLKQENGTERKYFYGKGVKRTAEGLCKQPEIQEHKRHHEWHEGTVQ